MLKVIIFCDLECLCDTDMTKTVIYKNKERLSKLTLYKEKRFLSLLIYINIICLGLKI